MAHGLDEGEYRRGLVLGLTLAEVLLLLLFLVMLTLASLYQTADRKRQELAAEHETVERELKVQTDKVAELNADQGRVETAEAIAFYRDVKQVVPETKRDAVLKALQQAAKLNPNDPPAVLIDGIAALETSSLAEEHTETPLPETPVAKGEHDWPPIITLSEAEGHFFPSGSADVPPGLQAVLRSKVHELPSLIAHYKVDIIEVIGHTDEQPIITRASNLDRTLLPLVRGTRSEREISADNAGLGLARAAAVVRLLRSDPQLKDMEILPLSGGQLIDVGDHLSVGGTAAAAASRRRIEIRLRRRTQEAGTAETTNSWAARLLPTVVAVPPSEIRDERTTSEH